MIKTRLSDLRNSRFKLYKESQGQEDSLYAKYAYCRTRETLAKEMNLDRRTIGKWEKGTAIPTIENLIELSKALDCTVEYFLGEWHFPETTPIQTASHLSGISPEIIRYGLEHPDYLDCLNFFMLPDNCSTLFNSITLCAWKEYWISSKLTDIANPLKDKIIEIFNEFNAVTPFDKISQTTYKEFLKSKLPKNSMSITRRKSSSGFNLKASLTPSKYMSLITSERELKYNEFIDYLSDYTYDTLIQNSILELQKNKLSQAFISLFTTYLSEDR